MELQNIENMMIVDYQGALINWDNKQLIELANNTASKYKGLVVTEDITKDITKEVAILNKLIKSIDDKRKLIKKDYNAPLTIFENNVKEVTGILTVAVGDLKVQLEVFEQQRREKVTEKLLAYKENLQRRFNLYDKYLVQIQFKDNFYNKTIEEKNILQDIEQQFIVLSNSQELEVLKIQQERERIEREAIERENKVKARYELINKINSETGLNFNYDNTKHYNDADLMIAYQREIKSIAEEKTRKFANDIMIKEQEKITVAEAQKQQEKIIAVNHSEKIFTQNKNDTYSLLIENLTKQQMDLIVLGLKQKMPLTTFREV